MKPEDCNPAPGRSAEEIIAGWCQREWSDVAKDCTLLAAAAVRLADAAAAAKDEAIMATAARRQRASSETLRRRLDRLFHLQVVDRLPCVFRRAYVRVPVARGRSPGEV